MVVAPKKSKETILAGLYLFSNKHEGSSSEQQFKQQCDAKKVLESTPTFPKAAVLSSKHHYIHWGTTATNTNKQAPPLQDSKAMGLRQVTGII
jgi:hypothetical protein